ncbi:CCA tRNA nucleotidyltransferase [Candidatus Woesearchaeota archaeon]|nr:CCA tRNA nucleotidyltransferase [Candidatus Woesearchaeota archaeon]MBW3018285.1 CCA tRNA nucleotidyltransferase [Candidatus Woesearchaeota archaeon]
MKFLQELIDENAVKLVEYQIVIDLIREELKKHDIKAEVVLGGSAAKNTCLKNYDLDIFVRFYKNPDSDLLEVVLKNVFKKVERLHGSRDYFKIHHKGMDYEIVPVLKILRASQAENVTDVSMLHVEWVKKHLKNPEEVKLAKLFCKAQSVYGAESYINGFSGYILEILTVQYGSFMKMMEAVSRWKPGIIIDVEKHYTNRKTLMKQLNVAKLQSPIIVIDPTQKDRNAAASVTMETFCKFILAARQFLENPSKGWFVKKKFSLSDVVRESRKYYTVLNVLKVEMPEGKQDVVGSKFLKVFKFIKAQLEQNDFQVFKAGYDLEESTMWYQTQPQRLPLYTKALGPRVWAPMENLNAFIDKYDNVFLEEDHLCAIKKRKHLRAIDLIKDLVKTEYVQEKVKKIIIR